MSVYQTWHGHPNPAEGDPENALPGGQPAQPHPLPLPGGEGRALLQLQSPHHRDVDAVGGAAGQEWDQPAH